LLPFIAYQNFEALMGFQFLITQQLDRYSQLEKNLEQLECKISVHLMTCRGWQFTLK
jgi:hypothetical protein